MKIGKSYKLSEFLDWTRRKLHVVLALAVVPVALLGEAELPALLRPQHDILL